MIDRLPHELFQLEVDKMLAEALRQENSHSTNVSELTIAQDFYNYLTQQVMPCIRSLDWVFEAASRFAEEFAETCFETWERAGREATRVRQQLDNTNEQVVDLIARLHRKGAISTEIEQLNLVKASDFIYYVDLEKLPPSRRREVKHVHEYVSRFEKQYLKTTNSLIREHYAKVLPRVMYVIQRVIKIELNLRDAKGFSKLQDISKWLDWYKRHITETHSLFPVLGFLDDFYKVARDVESHENDIEWRPKSDELHLPSDRNPQTFRLYVYQQKYRHLIYLLEMGMAAILAAYCERKRSESCNQLAEDYIATLLRIDRDHPLYGGKQPKVRIKPYTGATK